MFHEEVAHELNVYGEKMKETEALGNAYSSS